MTFISKITILIKAFERPGLLNRAVDSIRRLYPGIKILVADDGRNTAERDDVSYYVLPFDSGISVSRNFLLDLVITPYFYLMDDDHYFTDKTNLDKLHGILGMGADIAAPAVRDKKGINNFEGCLDIECGVMTHMIMARGTLGGCPINTFDIVHNTFLAKTASVRLIGGWDNRLKLSEHGDFFLRAKYHNLTVAYVPEVEVNHDKGGSKEYMKYRNRTAEFRPIWMKKFGIRKVIARDGSVYEEPSADNV